MPPKLANLDGLVRLSTTEGVDIRRPLLRVLTDLYVQEPTHTREEEQQYVELALQLLPAVDLATRAAVARKLATYPHTPAPIIDVLARDATDLAALFGATAAARAIDAAASQPDASETEDPPLPAWLETAMREPAPPATRPQPTVGADSIGEIFLNSTSAERLAFLANMERATSVGGAPSVSTLVRPGASRRLEQAALARRPEEFAHELRLALGVTGNTARRIADDRSGEPLLVAARALGISEEVLVRILLFINESIGHSIERVFALAALYGRITTEMIEPVVASWREETLRRSAGRLQPLHAADEADGVLGARENARTPRDGAADQGSRRGIGVERRQRGQGAG
jgi:hypothetical protein